MPDASKSAGGVRRAQPAASSRLRIVVLGYIVRGPVAGMAWHHLQYILGLARLGHDVYFVEDSDEYASCYEPVQGVVTADPTYGLRFATSTFQGVGLGDRWAYYDAHRTCWLGPRAHDIERLCRSADLLLNVSGVNPLRPWVMQIPVRALLDTDPVFTQIRHLTEPAAHALAAQHTAFFSFGQNIGCSHCSIPDDGFPWQATRQPVVLDAWAVTPGPAEGRFTTVMQWDSYPAREYGGRHYGMKSAAFEPYMDLPARAGDELELALGSATAPRELLAGKGWHIRDPLEPTRDIRTYQEYIRQSKAEFSVAKHGYVVSRSGWFSERSAVYLASGRPVLVQDTGFRDWLPAGTGLLSFTTPEEALQGLEEINRRYADHCRVARALAEEYFDAHKLLPQLIHHAVNSHAAAENRPAVAR